MAAETYRAVGSVLGRKPELIHLLVFVIYLALFDPKRWVFRRLGFDPCDREILGIHPNFSAIEELVVGFRLNRQDIGWSALGSFQGDHGEFVVPVVQIRALAIFLVRRFLLSLQQPLEN